MDDHELFKRILDQICKVAAEAVQRYVEVSGVHPVGDRMPEYILQSIVFDRLGRNVQGTGMVMRLDATLQNFGGALGRNERPDMALFRPLDERQLFALLEYKRGQSGVVNARDTLTTLMDALPICPFGAICSMHADGSDPYLSVLEKQALDVGDSWHCAEAVLPSHVRTRYMRHYIFARGFRRKP